MIFGLFRRKTNHEVIDAIHGEIMAQARQSTFFTGYGVPDTVEGRFEMVALHGVLAIRRLEQLAAPGPELAQELTDSIFRHFDVALREMGVGDMAVPKRMKKLASGFLGRSASYRAALDSADLALLTRALGRNVYGEGERAKGAKDMQSTETPATETLATEMPATEMPAAEMPDAVWPGALAHYVLALEKVYADAGLEVFLAGRAPGLDAAEFLPAATGHEGKGA